MKSKKKLGLLMIIMVVFLAIGCTNGASEGPSIPEKKTTTEQTDHKETVLADESGATVAQKEENPVIPPVEE